MFARRALKWGTAALLLVVVSSFAYAGASAALSSGASAQVASGPVYNVTFTETGLAAGTNWSVSVFGGANWSTASHESLSSTTSSITFSLANGTYRYHVRGVSGYDLTSGSRGTFNVSGASPAPIAVTFTVPTTYVVTFSETGLPSGTNWTVRVHAEGGFGRGGWRGHRADWATSNTSTITFELTNGTYGYSVHAAGYYAVNGSRGTVTVNGSSPPTIVVTFSTPVPRTLYAVTFSETGLPAGTNWTVLVASGGGWYGYHHHHHAFETTSNSSLSFALPNGTYRYVVFPVPGYAIANNGSRGTFNVTGSSPATIQVVFVPLVTYGVTFSETGLPSGTNWSVVVASAGGPGSSAGISTGASSNTSTISFELPNGTYWFHVGFVPGFSANNTSFGTFNVSGASPPPIDITFTPSSWVPSTPMAVAEQP